MARYTIDVARERLVEMLAARDVKVDPADVRDVDSDIGADLAVPLFRAARDLKQNPIQLADKVAAELDLAGTPFSAVAALKGYLNFTLDPGPFVAGVFEDFARTREDYGSRDDGKGSTVVIDYSSPNIAKPFSVGHLRSTIIGQALHNVLSRLGYRAVGDNHVGDWGTQFGKLLCAWSLWGDEAELDRGPTRHLLDLYVRFHEEAKADPSLENKAREWFRRLEQGDPESRARWQRFVEHSTAEFARIYDLLGVEIDNQLGESFYEDRLQGVIDRALESGVARREKPLEPVNTGEEKVDEDETVVLVPLDSEGIDTPLILQKSDGTSLYATREIATADYRVEKWHPDRLVYVVGNEQEFYFRQFAAALKLLGHEEKVEHVSFGLIRLPEGRMSTREGRVILLEDVIREAVSRAREVLADREMTEDEKDRVARIVGIGALKYADLSQNRVKDVVFSWDRMLALDGDSAPYLQYAHTRCRSILRKAGDVNLAGCEPGALGKPGELALVRRLARFPDAVRAAGRTCEPHRIANYLYRLAQEFSVFYNKVPVLKAESGSARVARLRLVEMTGTVIRLGLGLLGIGVPEKM